MLSNQSYDSNDSDFEAALEPCKRLELFKQGVESKPKNPAIEESNQSHFFRFDHKKCLHQMFFLLYQVRSSRVDAMLPVGQVI